jgi:hypothetical protein
VTSRGDRRRADPAFPDGPVQSRLAYTQEAGRLPGADELNSRTRASSCVLSTIVGKIIRPKPPVAAWSHHGRMQQTPRHGTQNRRPAHAKTVC